MKYIVILFAFLIGLQTVKAQKGSGYFPNTNRTKQEIRVMLETPGQMYNLWRSEIIKDINNQLGNRGAISVANLGYVIDNAISKKGSEISKTHRVLNGYLIDGKPTHSDGSDLDSNAEYLVTVLFGVEVVWLKIPCLNPQDAIAKVDIHKPLQDEGKTLPPPAPAKTETVYVYVDEAEIKRDTVYVARSKRIYQQSCCGNNVDYSRSFISNLFPKGSNGCAETFGAGNSFWFFGY